MPGLDGLEVYRELRRMAPAVRVLFSSGYGERPQIHRVSGGAPVRFLKKPYRPHELVREVCSLLEQ